MALSQVQVDSFKMKAKRAGYSDAQIQSEIARKNSEPVAPVQQPTPQAQAPAVQPPIQPQQPTKAPSVAGMVGGGAIAGTKSAASMIGSLAMKAPKLALDVAKEFAKPAVKVGKTIGSATEAIGQQAKYSMGNKKAFLSPILPDALKLNQEQLDQTIQNPVEESIKNTAGLMSYGVPFGKAGFVGSKAIAPGAAVAGMRSVSEGETPEEVLGNALIGGATGGVLQGAGKVLSKLKMGSKSLADVAGQEAKVIEQGTRRIRVKPGISGAQQEDAINDTLNSLGFKGGPQDQYANLKPAMQKLEGKIKAYVAENPDLSVKRMDIKKSFLTNLKSTLRSGEMTQKQAAEETDKYLSDLIKSSGGKGKFTNIDIGKLRDLKKLVNEDYGPVKDILDRGGNLTPRQHVIKVSWDSLDQAVRKAAPEVKDLLVQESHLYKAAKPLSAARSNPPTLRFAGISLPQAVTQGFRDAAKGGLETTAGLSKNISEAIPAMTVSPAAKTIGGQVASILPRLGVSPDTAQEGQYIQDGGQQDLSYENSNINANNQQDYSHGGSLPQSPSDVQFGAQTQTQPPTKPIYNNQWQAPPEALYREYQNAYQFGDIKTAAYLYKVYQDEVKYQEKAQKKGGSSFTSGQLKELSDIQNSIDLMNGLEPILEKSSVLFGPIRGQLGKNPYATESKALEAEFRTAAQLVGKAMEGGVLRKEDEEKYRKMLPQITDTVDVARRKIENVRRMVQMQLATKKQFYSSFEVTPEYSAGLGSAPSDTSFLQDQGLGAEPAL